MERREELHRHGCSIAKQTILTTHPSGLQTRVSVELANFDALCLHTECKSNAKRPWDGSPFLARRGLTGGVSAHATPVLGRRSDLVNEGRLSQQCTPVMRRREVLDSPGGSPLLSRRADVEEEDCSGVDNSVISGWLKFRDNKRGREFYETSKKMSVSVLDYKRGKSLRDVFGRVLPPDTPRTGNELPKVISVYSM
ncbi:unnamed protein product [Arctia plantaginis]|uniref:Uncharacterized protein n=1 Tax=Arctia plantaginis TaxID=874455 RepID=A0A8S0ZCU3_ARCPL|nr:unnamed protein product [Arctia plantaginis]